MISYIIIQCNHDDVCRWDTHIHDDEDVDAYNEMHIHMMMKGVTIHANKKSDSWIKDPHSRSPRSALDSTQPEHANSNSYVLIRALDFCLRVTNYLLSLDNSLHLMQGVYSEISP